MLISELHHLPFFWKLFKCQFINQRLRLDLLLKSHIPFLKSGSVSAPTLFSIFKIVLTILGPLCYCINFKINLQGFPGGAVVKNPPAKAGDTGSSPGPGRSHTPRSN